MTSNVTKLDEAKKRRRGVRDGVGSGRDGGGDAGGTSGGNDLPVIQIVDGELPRVVDQVEAALTASGSGPIFQRAGMLVHVADRPARRTDGSKDMQKAIEPVVSAALLEGMAQVATFEKYDRRYRKLVRRDPPRALAEAYMARRRWRVPDLRQFISVPTLRGDGTLISREGYDAATGLYLTTELKGLTVPDKPSRRQAEAGNEKLVELLNGFPFEEDPPGVALAVAMAGILGSILRPTLSAAPLIGVSAPQAGTGKSYLVDVIAMLATGHRAVGIATGNNPEEFEKSVGAVMLEGRPLLVLDNVVTPIAGQLMCMLLTQERVALRILGQSKAVDVPASVAFFATGNQLRVKGDMARRTLICGMDAGVEHPEERAFDGDLLAEVRARRPELVSAALTILRWHRTNRDPVPLTGRRLAGFDDWCERVRDPLVALGHADPVATLDVARAVDSDRGRLAALADAWWERFADTPKTTAEVIVAANRASQDGDPEAPELSDAVAAIAGERRTRSILLGNYLAKVERRIVDGRRFVKAGTKARATRWQMQTVGE